MKGTILAVINSAVVMLCNSVNPEGFLTMVLPSFANFSEYITIIEGHLLTILTIGVAVTAIAVNLLKIKESKSVNIENERSGTLEAINKAIEEIKNLKKP